METWQRAEIPTFQRVNVREIKQLEKNHTKAIRQALARIFTLANLPYYFLGFLLGRACMLGDSFPFGIAYLTYLLGTGPKGRLYATGAAVFLGIFSYYPGLWALDYAVVLLLLFFWDKHLRSYRRMQIEKLPLVALVAVFLGRGSVELFRWRGFPGLLSLVIEAACAMLLTAIFVYGFPALRKGKSGWRQRALQHEEIICLTILTVALLMGTEQLEIMGLSLGNVMGRLLILLLALVGGGGAGAVAGILVGIVGALNQDFSPYLIAISAFAGLLAGTFRNYGKRGVIGGFLLGTVIMFLQITQTAELTSTITESFIAILLFVFMPKGLSLTLSRALPGTEERMELEEKKQERLQTLVIKRLSQFAEIFCELSSTFNQGAAANFEDGNISLERLVEALSNQICKSCSSYDLCWQENFYFTYQKMMELIAAIEEQRYPDGFSSSSCPHLERLVTTLRYLFSMQRLDRSWQQKLMETSNIVSSQLRGIAKVMDNLAMELNTEVTFKEDLEELVQKELSKLGFVIGRVEVMELEDNKVAVEIDKTICDGSEECRKAISPLVGQILSRDFTIWNVRCGRQNCRGRCIINLVPKRPFQVESSVQRFNKADGIISGDSHALLELQDGKLAVALSDGMGSGAEAALQSEATISILKRLLESGFDRESAVRTVNSVLLARSVEESFATIDLAVFDLHKGQLELIKVGAAPTYIKRGREVVRIDSACLPIGILSSIEIESTSRKLADGDIVVMVTDGLTQLRRSGGPAIRGDWIARMLQRLQTTDPEEIAYELLCRAREINFNQVEDDMTVLVLKVVACQREYSWQDSFAADSEEQVAVG